MSISNWIWDDERVVAFDVETSGDLTGVDTDTGKPVSSYALQPWRVPQGKAWLTSASVLRYDPAQKNLVPFLSQLYPTKEHLIDFLQAAIRNKWTVVGWNLAYDISMMIAHGLDDLVQQVRWLDGLLLWRHLDMEPEYEFQKQRHLKRKYRLKPEAVQEFIPRFAGLDEDVDFHSREPADLDKLQRYNDRDNVRAWTICKIIWSKLEPRQRQAALVECACLPMVAQANFHGLAIDRLAVRHLSAQMDAEAEKQLIDLAPHGMTEKIVRSPVKLASLMFDPPEEGGWGLPVLKENPVNKKGEKTRSTDKEVLHELSFMDERAKKVKSYRESLNAKSKFCTAVLKSLDYNESPPFTHPVTNVAATYTHRMTVSSKQGRNKNLCQIGFALHQMKRGKEFREIVTVPDGYTLVEFDAAGQEYRWMAIASGDPTMLQLCRPGEDMHSYMGAQIVGQDYHDLIRKVKAEEPAAGQTRYLGKFANLCIAEGTTILTDRGPCSIEQVRDTDLVWDGEKFVAHAGVRFSGVFPVITYQGVTGTPDHKVLIDGSWVQLQEAARHGWRIEPALGAGRTHPARAAVRIVGGVVGRAVREVGGALRAGALRLRDDARCEFTFSRDRAVHAVQGLRDQGSARSRRRLDGGLATRAAVAETGQRMVSAVPEPEGQVLAQLRRAWDRVPVCFGTRRGGVCPARAAAPNIPQARYRPGEQRWSLRAWKLALGFAQRESRQSGAVQARTYDIVNCGPRTRFAANGRIVHNSLQYRTSARKLRVKARVDYEIPMELPEAQRIHKTYQRTYPGVPVYWDKQIAIVKSCGFVETFGGTRVQVRGDWNGKWGWSMGSTAINTRIQGTGADQKYLALAVLQPYLAEIGARFYFELHDGLFFLIPNDILASAVDKIKHMLDNLPYQQAWGFTPPIPLPWDCKFGKRWGYLKEWHFN